MLTRTKELLLVPPACEPISLDDAKRQCRVLDDNEDDYIQSLVTVARKTLERICWSSFITQTWQYWWDHFSWKLYIPRPPLRYPINTTTSVVAFEYVPPSATGSSTFVAVDPTVWELSAQDELPFLRVQYLKTMPITRGYRDDVRLTVKTGYGDSPEDVPDPIRHAIKMYVAHLYPHRGDEPAEFPRQIWDLVEGYRYREF
jgi:uncharacterized phiE125 gp8 family phage protein